MVETTADEPVGNGRGDDSGATFWRSEVGTGSSAQRANSLGTRLQCHTFAATDVATLRVRVTARQLADTITACPASRSPTRLPVFLMAQSTFHLSSSRPRRRLYVNFPHHPTRESVRTFLAQSLGEDTQLTQCSPGHCKPSSSPPTPCRFPTALCYSHLGRWWLDCHKVTRSRRDMRRTVRLNSLPASDLHKLLKGCHRRSPHTLQRARYP